MSTEADSHPAPSSTSAPAWRSSLAVAAAADALLAQCDALLAQVSGPAYVAPSRVLPGGTVGKHVRHLLDHYSAALAAAQRCPGIEAGEPIDYDHRARNTPVESELAVARGEIARLRTTLGGLDHAALAQHVRLRVMLAADGSEAVLDSTLAREIAFATHHGVHHQAMIGAVCREQGVPVPAEFGTAPSTLHHLARTAAVVTTTPAGAGAR